MVTSSGSLHDCHGNTALAASIHIISHVGSLQCTCSLSHDSYCIYVHALISFYLLSIGPTVRLRYCRSHVPVYLSPSLCYSFQLPLFFTCLSFCPFVCVFFSLDYFLCTVVSPSTVLISAWHKTLVLTEGRIRQGKSGNFISSPGKGKHFSFFLSVQLRCRIRN